jgi:hypothetical protein
MVQDAKRMRCGNCGCGTMEVYCKGGERFYPSQLFIECQGCKSVTEVKLTLPKLVLDWGEGAEGILSVF